MKGPESLNNLIDKFKQLPGVGRKTAERFAYFILKTNKEKAESIARGIFEVKEKVRLCSVCYSFTESETCDICRNDNRKNGIICVVQEPHDVFSIEKSKEFRGKYHVLLGALSPLDGVKPSDLKIEDLRNRVRNENIREVIIATNPNTEGETTAMYIAKFLKQTDTKVTRIAKGLPVGSDLEYADEVTISSSLRGRQEL